MKEVSDMEVLKDMKALHSDMIRWRRDLHRIPELTLELPKTVAYLKRELESMGITYNTLVNGNAIVAVISGEKGKGKTIGLRADMDALPIPEETNLDFAAKNGCMHACGHDAHTAMALGAAELLIRHKEDLKGCVKDMVEIGKKHGARWLCAGKCSRKGHPHHPLYLRSDEKTADFDIEAYLDNLLV